MFQALDN